jgi:hypothetical protein
MNRLRFRYLAPLYDFSPNQSHIGAPARGEAKLREMACCLVGSDDLVAIYIPETTEAVYRPGNKRGRVVGGVQLVQKPEDRDIRDYQFKDDPSLRWPFGWPCRAVYAPPVEECPMLRDIVGPNSFRTYVGRLRHGPFELDDPEVAKKLEAWFARFPTVSDC